jgi:hypothetical protein
MARYFCHRLGTPALSLTLAEKKKARVLGIQAPSADPYQLALNILVRVYEVEPYKYRGRRLPSTHPKIQPLL